MNHDKFREQFEQLGFDVSVDREPPEDKDLGVLVAENDRGDEIFWSVIADPEQWGLYVSPAGFTLDDATFEWHDADFGDNSVSFDGVSGTRSKQFGYGRAAFRGTLTIDTFTAEVCEVHTP